MKKNLIYEIELPPIKEDPEEAFPEKIIAIPAWGRGNTMLVLVSAGENSKLVQKDFAVQQAKALVSWFRSSVPGYFYDAMVKEIERCK